MGIQYKYTFVEIRGGCSRRRIVQRLGAF